MRQPDKIYGPKWGSNNNFLELIRLPVPFTLTWLQLDFLAAFLPHYEVGWQLIAPTLVCWPGKQLNSSQLNAADPSSLILYKARDRQLAYCQFRAREI